MIPTRSAIHLSPNGYGEEIVQTWDADGDIVFLTNSPDIVPYKINRPMTIDVEDKATADAVEYNQENIIKYELNSRDSRIGNITNICASIINKVTTSEEGKKWKYDNVSLLRLHQGKEIDYVKTGIRWKINKSLQKQLKQIPYFLLYNYPDKLSRYYKLAKINSLCVDDGDKIPLNCYFSPSPMNELCDYINTWEKQKIIWDTSVRDNRDIILDYDIDYSNNELMREVTLCLTDFNNNLNLMFKHNRENNNTLGRKSIELTTVIKPYEQKINEIRAKYGEELTNQYLIYRAYKYTTTRKTLAWMLAGDTILANIKKNTPANEKWRYMVLELDKPTDTAHEYLGRYYKLVELGDCGYESVLRPFPIESAERRNYIHV